MVVKDFEKILVETKQGTLLKVHAKPDSKNFALGLDEWKGSLEVKLRAKPEKGKANKELLKKLRKIFDADIEIIKGKKSSKKTLLIDAEKKRVLKSLSSL